MAHNELCVTLGGVERLPSGGWSLTGEQLRASIPDSRGHNAEMTFRYLGQTPREIPMRSGGSRHQLGLKLLEQDTCNLLYVMWRVSPESEIVVSRKHNPGATRHTECGSDGYQTLEPAWTAPVAAPVSESVHTLSARIVTDWLEVAVDGRPVLRTRLAPEMTAVTGHAGLRSDNVRFELIDAKADMLDPESSAAAPGCKALSMR